MSITLPRLTMLALMPALAACAEMTLPDLTVPVGEDITFGTDPTAADPVLGVTVIDPFRRMYP